MIRTLILILVLVSLLAGCADTPTYTPPPQVQATREAEAYNRHVTRNQTAWWIGVAFMVLFLGILIFLSWQLRGVGYRIQAAKAAKKEAENRRLDFIPLGNDKLYDVKHKTVISGAAAIANGLPPIMPAQAIPTPPKNGNRHAEFIRQAAHYHPEHYNGKTIPRFDKMGYASPHEWEEITKDLRGDELIDVSPAGTTIRDGQTLGWLLNLIISNPYD